MPIDTIYALGIAGFVAQSRFLSVVGHSFFTGTTEQGNLRSNVRFAGRFWAKASRPPPRPTQPTRATNATLRSPAEYPAVRVVFKDGSSISVGVGSYETERNWRGSSYRLSCSESISS